MSFAQPFSESHSIQTSIQLQKTDGNSGGASSPVKTPGGSTPGAPMGSVPGEMKASRTNLKTRQGGLKRSWY